MLRAKNNTNFKGYLKYLEEGKVQNSTVCISQAENFKLQINYSCLLKDFVEKKIKPIIVVPSMGRSGNISLYNSKQFISDGNYVDSENKYYDGVERTIQIEKDIKGYKFTFEIYDNVGTFERRNNNKGKWDRVVAVFVTGQKYQFKSWPLENNIPTQLDQIRGFYLRYSEQPIPEQVGNWNVKVLDIFRHKRHLDKAAHDLFWIELENFLTQPRIQKDQK
ncbi:hypothetical protein IMG5_203730 [Ichthyophthirius multifiliis]|uniref:Cell division control protein 73 C-terminal domain-containing protein n=1 Tax=Ichthyophthirius multifiliis TaxID=5932 RepID=G0R6C9_ICHMU|nr:hypothetical protein IMG5_203730 [Ichthyophthirius multifiliis]EGR26974.1 hypothetical protein IMG5_203730 [Ichthyophthirius multifiliis]|eukprot:XP_004023858.1 hypothetical protein IMG5_203730 [Ichthyophthirius multifiliis]